MVSTVRVEVVEVVLVVVVVIILVVVAMLLLLFFSYFYFSCVLYPSYQGLLLLSVLVSLFLLCCISKFIKRVATRHH